MSGGPKFLELIIENAYNIAGRNSICLDNMGLVNFIGRNYDASTSVFETIPGMPPKSEVSSNGTGKSTAVKCLLRVLYGEKVTKHETVKEALNGKNFLIGLKIERRGVLYEAYDVRKHSDFEKDGLHCFYTPIGGKRKPFGRKNAGKKLREEFTKAAVGMTFEEFTNSTVITQGSTHVLIKGTPQERVEFISKMFGLDTYDELHIRFKTKLETVQSEIDSLVESKVRYSILKKRLSEISESADISEMQSLKDKWIKRRQDLVVRRKSIRSIIEQASAAQEAYMLFKSAQNALSEFKSKYGKYNFDNCNATIEALEAKLEKITKSLATAESKQKAYDNLQVMKRQRKNLKNSIPEKYSGLTLKEIKSKIEALQDKEAKRTDALRKLAGQRELIEAVQVNLQQLEQIGMMEADYDEAKAAVVEFAEKEKEQEAAIQGYLARLEVKESVDTDLHHCPTCGSEIDGKKVEKEIERLRGLMIASEKKRKEFRRIHQRNKLFCDTQDLIEKNNIDTSVNEATLRELAESIQKIRNKVDALKSVLDKLYDLDKIKAQIATLDGAEQVNVSEIEASLEEVKAKLKVYRQYKSLERSIPKSVPKKPQSDVNDLRSELDEVDSKIDSVTKKLERVSSALVEYEKTTSELGELKGALKRLKALEMDARVLSGLCLAYGKRGLKVKKIREIVEEIKTNLPAWIALLFPEKGFKVETIGNEKKIGFIATQTFKEGKKTVTKSFDIRNVSGGEKTRVMIAILLTLMGIIAEDKKSNLCILDELEAGLDPVNRNIVSDQLVPLLKKRKPTLCVISHSLNMPRRTFNHEVIFERRNFKTTITTNKLRAVA